MTLYACSSNPGKLRELVLSARKLDWEVSALPSLARLAPPEETGSSFEDNAMAKALYYSLHSRHPVIADDSGLSVDALHGAPGVWSSRFAGPNATEAQNNALLLQRLSKASDRTARFVSVVAIAQTGQLLAAMRGEAEGVILAEPRGTGGFGYDPLFYYAPLGRTFAELDEEQKAEVSARGQAVRAALEQLSGSIQNA